MLPCYSLDRVWHGVQDGVNPEQIGDSSSDIGGPHKVVLWNFHYNRISLESKQHNIIFTTE